MFCDKLANLCEIIVHPKTFRRYCSMCQDGCGRTGNNDTPPPAENNINIDIDIDINIDNDIQLKTV